MVSEFEDIYNSNKKVFVLHDQVDWETESIGELRTVFCDGHLLVDEDLATIRARLASNL